MNYEKTGIDRWAKVDPSLIRLHQGHYEHVPTFDSVLIRILQRGDFEAAEFITSREKESDLALRSVRDSQIILVQAISAGRKAA